MSDNAKETKYIRAQVPDEDRCVFTTNHGNRCTSPHQGNATGLCLVHAARAPRCREEIVDEAEVKAVAEQLLAKNVGLATREDVNRITSQLYTMVAEKRVSRQDGGLLAYIASVMLQTITPQHREPDVEEPPQIPQSPAVPIPREQIYRNATFREPQMPGRTYNPYMYPTKLK